MIMVWDWLTQNEQSPFVGCPSCVLKAMDIDKSFWGTLKTQFKKGKLWLRFSVRMRMTAKFKQVLSGEMTVANIVRDKKNRPRSFDIVFVPNPVPLPIPNWYRGTIEISRRGLKMKIKSVTVEPAPDRSKLFNPFGR